MLSPLSDFVKHFANLKPYDPSVLYSNTYFICDSNVEENCRLLANFAAWVYSEENVEVIVDGKLYYAHTCWRPHKFLFIIHTKGGLFPSTFDVGLRDSKDFIITDGLYISSANPGKDKVRLVLTMHKYLTEYFKAQEEFTINSAFHALEDKNSLPSLMIGVMAQATTMLYPQN